MDEEPEVYVSDVVGGGPNKGAVVSLTPIKAGDLTAEHVGRSLGFNDARIQVNVCGEILRIEHNDGPTPSVSVWFRYEAPILGRASRDDFMRVAPWFGLQLVETLSF